MPSSTSASSAAAAAAVASNPMTAVSAVAAMSAAAAAASVSAAADFKVSPQSTPSRDSPFDHRGGPPSPVKILWLPQAFFGWGGAF